MASRTKVPDWLIKDTGEQPGPGYDEWFRAKVERALEEMKHPSLMIPAEEVWRRFGFED